MAKANPTKLGGKMEYVFGKGEHHKFTRCTKCLHKYSEFKHKVCPVCGGKGLHVEKD